MNFKRIPFALLLTLTVSGCGSIAIGDRDAMNEPLPSATASESSVSEAESELASSDAANPDEAKTDKTARITAQSPEELEPIMPALLRFLDNHGANPQETQYLVEYVDLNGDGLDEALVLLSGDYWCGTGGCNMAVFEGTPEGHTLVSNLSLVNAPVWVSSDRSSGWNDLIVKISGGGIETKHVALRFNGFRYPVNPSLEPAVDQAITENSQPLFRSLVFQNIPIVQSNSSESQQRS